MEEEAPSHTAGGRAAGCILRPPMEQLELAFSPVMGSEASSVTAAAWPAQGHVVGHQWT